MVKPIHFRFNHAGSNALGAIALVLFLGVGVSAEDLGDSTDGIKPNAHWAFKSVKSIEPPAVEDGEWSGHPIDRFVFSEMRGRGLVPVEDADKRTLIRRVTYDLIGLPPRPEEVDAFLADDSPEAWRKLVDRLLASPRYGERWGRHWMDVVRYADTAGDNADYPIPEARLYRDYIIDSFNADKPYDEFVKEQLAGDLLAAEGPKARYAEQVTGTGFIALSRRFGTMPTEHWHLVIEDTLETTGRAFLGLTLRCARCHDHKIDPVTMKDYYGLYGFFAATEYPYAGSEEFQSKQFPRRGFAPLLPPDEAEPLLKKYEEAIQGLEQKIPRIEKEGELAKQVATLTQQISELSGRIEEAGGAETDKAALEAERSALEKQKAEATKKIQEQVASIRRELEVLRRPGLPADLPGAYGVRDGKPNTVHVHQRGDPGKPGEAVERTVPAVLAGDGPIEVPPNGSGRLALARWLTRGEHPLTARVMVNRIWQHHFGRGIVGTASNFGMSGEAPTHPALLDWLAGQFVQSGWSIKAMHRLMLQSKAYRLSSSGHSGNEAKDPGNRFYWRFDRRRLEAEAIRDAMLAVSGELDLSRPGRHPFPPIRDWHYTQHQPFKAVYPSLHRSVYLMTQRLQRHPYLALFDGADPNNSVGQRTSAIVPTQALYMMNNQFVKARAEAFARRLIDSSANAKGRVALAYKLAYGRGADDEELERGAQYVTHYADALGAEGTDSELEAWTSYARILLTANEFMFLD